MVLRVLRNWAALLVLALAAAPVCPQSRSDERLREAEGHYQDGQELMASESFEEAARAFQRALDAEPRYFMAAYGLGQAHLAQKRYPDAIAAYNGCIETVAEVNSDIQSERVRLDQQREDELREAQEILRRLQAVEAQQPEAAGVRGEIIRTESRIETLQQAKMRGSQRRVEVPPGLYVGLGSAYLHTGQLNDAEKAYEDAIEADASLGAAHNNLAFIYFKTGRFELAKEQIALAEEAGVRVHPQFKKDVEKAARQ